MATDLLFRALAATGHPVDLIFGADEGGGDDAALLEIQGALQPPTLVVEADAFIRDDLAIAITALRPVLVVSAAYDNAVQRGPRGEGGGRWQGASAAPVEAGLAHQQARALYPEHRAPWGAGTAARRVLGLQHRQLARVRRERGMRWAAAQPRAPGERRSSWQERARTARPGWSAAWDAGTPAKAGLDGAWQQRRAVPVAHASAWQEAAALAQELILRARDGADHPLDLKAPWGEATHPLPGRTVITPVDPEPPQEPCYEPPAGDQVHLLFKELWDGSTALLFSCGHDDDATVVVPIRRVYIVINSVLLRRVQGDIQLPALSLSLSIDADSWTWSFSATLPASALADIEPSGAGEPVELEATINGVAYRLIAEQVARERSFGRSTIRVGGRGRSAMLDAPYAPVLNFGSAEARTAQQLMADVLTLNGVGIGWDVDWTVEDWLVPGGLFAHQGSYIAALNAIAGAAGAYIQPHATEQQLRVLARYPSAPWAWAGIVADFELPAAVTTRESIEWVERARYNRVFVSGTAAGGILGQVTRAGTAGDLVAPMVTDPLISAAAAARQRGLPELANTGRQALLSLRLPVLAETGIITPGRFVQYVEGGTTWRGLVRSTSVEAGRPDVWQTIGVETHA